MPEAQPAGAYPGAKPEAVAASLGVAEPVESVEVMLTTFRSGLDGCAGAKTLGEEYVRAIPGAADALAAAARAELIPCGLGLQSRTPLPDADTARWGGTPGELGVAQGVETGLSLHEDDCSCSGLQAAPPLGMQGLAAPPTEGCGCGTWVADASRRTHLED